VSGESRSDIDLRLSVPAGLCASCAHTQVVETARRSVFFLCRLSVTDPRFSRYPRLPVVSCPGYRVGGAEARDLTARPSGD
jgi:hypothetical protein